MSAILVRLRNHIVTGFIFIMPVLITLAVLMKFWKDLLKIGGGFSRLLRVDTVLGPPGDAVMAVIFFLLICIAAGFLIRISSLRRISEGIDVKLNELIPGYSKIRTQTTKKIGRGDQALFDACMVKAHDLWQPAYIIEGNPDGTQTVFVPQAPTFNTGQVIVVDASRIQKLDMDSAALNAHLKKLGQGIMRRTR